VRWYLVCMALLLMAGTEQAQAQTPVQTPAEALIDVDSVRVATAASVAVLESSDQISPRVVLWRSALVPGWGQLSQGHPIKAVLFAGAAAGWLSAVVADASSVSRSSGPLERQDRAARRNTRVLYYVITATLAGVDAYVDAHLDDFHLEADPFAAAGARLTLCF